MIGKQISHYKIIEQLGAGGMGVVYKAEDTKLKRTVALKFLPPELTREPDAKERFIREAQAASSLDHPNICTIHEINETMPDSGKPGDGQMFIVMACYEGQTLKDKIRDTRLKTEEAVDIAVQIAQGLERAHQEGIVHRDIKPANIIITDRGEVKILDFGLAKLTGQAQLTKDSSTLGTAAYMSPEQCSGREFDQRTDIWSLGVVLYEMLSGELPFRGEYEQAVLYSILNEEPEQIETIPSELQGVIGRALQKNPDERYASISEFLNDLTAIRDNDKLNKNFKPSPKSTRKKVIIISAAAAFILIAIITVLYFSQSDAAKETSKIKRLVVLPFENLGLPEDDYFADGMTEEITSRLSMLHGLGVISRSSAMHYKNTDKTVQQIGEDLVVDYILEGTIRWDKISDTKGRVKVSPRLIHVSDDILLWSESYNRMLENIFDIQTEIAQEVIKALDIKVLEPEREELYQKPTDNLEAYDLFIRAREIRQKYLYTEPAKLDSAVQLFKQAVKIDENLVMAYGWISEIHSWLYHIRFDFSEERQAKAKSAIEIALELQPDLPEVKLFRAYYFYWIFKDYERAKELFNEVKKQRPNQSPELLAYIERRQNNWGNSVLHFREAFKLDPRTPGNAMELGTTYMCMRKYEEAAAWLSRHQVLEPSDALSISKSAKCYILAGGNINAAKSALSSIKKINEQSGEFFRTLILIELFKKNFNQVLNLFESFGIKAIDGQHLFMDKYCLKAYVHHLLGDGLQCRLYADSSVMVINEKMEKNPNDPRYHSALGITYAFQGKKAEAVSAAIRAAELYPISLDAFDGPNYVYNLAWVYTIIGEHDKAIEQLEYLLSISAGGLISKAKLKINPKWKNLRNHTRFQELIE